jgi:hypothetical protein
VAPFIIVAQVTPDASTIVPLAPMKAQEFTVPFRSVDAGENLQGNLYLDRDPGTLGSWRATTEVPASIADFDQQREVTVTFTPLLSIQPGCHTLTFILAHESIWTIPPGSDPPAPIPLDDTQAASITWWIDLAGEDGASRRECPKLGEVTP